MSEVKNIYDNDDYVMSQEKLLLDNAVWDETLRRRYQEQESAKEQARIELKRQRLEKIRLAICLAEEERLAREAAEERSAGQEGAPDIVPAELVKEEADSMLAEAREQLEQASRQQEETAAVLREARMAAERMTEEMRLAAEKKTAEVESAARAQGEKEGQEKGHAEGYQKGLDEGTAKGLEQGLKELSELKDSYQRVTAELAQRADAAIDNRAEKVSEVVMDIVRQVVAAELATNHEVVANVVREALAKVKDTSKLIVHLNPQDIQEARRHRHDFMAVLDGVFSLQMVEDENVGRGGCLIETGSGLVDARLASKMKEIAGELELPAQGEGELADVVAPSDSAAVSGPTEILAEGVAPVTEQTQTEAASVTSGPVEQEKEEDFLKDLEESHTPRPGGETDKKEE